MAKPQALDRVLPYMLVIGGVIGIICSFVITYDKMQLMANPNYHPGCSINPVISCGSVMQSGQSHLFGFSNPILGLIGFPVVATIGMAMLAGAAFKRWFWLGLQAALTLGVVFIHWLFF